MKEKAEEALTEMKYCRNEMLRLVKIFEIDCKEVAGGRCMRDDGKLCFSMTQRYSLEKVYRRDHE